MELGQEEAARAALSTMDSLHTLAGQIILGTIGLTVNGRNISFDLSEAQVEAQKDLLLNAVAEDMVVLAATITLDHEIAYPAYMNDAPSLIAHLETEFVL